MSVYYVKNMLFDTTLLPNQMTLNWQTNLLENLRKSYNGYFYQGVLIISILRTFRRGIKNLIDDMNMELPLNVKISADAFVCDIIKGTEITAKLLAFIDQYAIFRNFS